ncbi:hypothetical protein [Streptomyces scabiei]|uniref:zinc finger domain-containing protein n=1 Tax=Streptomyces scabiei TaxID=1930 RepID=UPI0029AB3522|nr:hypothetical protein [Streptomyces scabiei]MDX3520758.1 hypothetical protein [Streptomyces scabiei]
MNPREAAELLGHCAMFDNRKPSQGAAVAWASALHDIPLDADAKAAVSVFYTTPPKDPEARLWIMPHHIRSLRAKIRSARLVNFQYEPVGDETVDEYLIRLRGQTQAIASGRAAAPPSGRLALEADPKRDREFVKELTARGWEGTRSVADTDEEAAADAVRRAGPLGVECPACHAAIGRPCKSPGGSEKQPLGKPRSNPHSARLRAAQGVPERTREQREAEEQRIRARAAAHLARQTDDIPDAEIVEDQP